MHSTARALELAAALCNEARGNSGDPIDVALSRWVTGYEEIRTHNPRRWVYPFDTAKRLMATANVVDSEERFYVKGAYEELKKHADNAPALGDLELQIETMAGRGLRVLAFGAGQWRWGGSCRMEVLHCRDRGIHRSAQGECR